MDQFLNSTTIRCLPGEQVIMSSNGDMLMLTTRRVIYLDSKMHQTTWHSISLEQVASCSMHARANPILLGLAAIALIAGLVFLSNREEDAAGISLGAAVLLVLGYFFSRRATIIIASAGGEAISVPVRGMGKDKVLDFLNTVDAAIAQRR
ncbi:MAG: hypothetical protein MK101_04310 [Phycisphaerales bacterium]|nr:hypothetical protein [Phycisphaerales bacterium]